MESNSTKMESNYRKLESNSRKIESNSRKIESNSTPFAVIARTQDEAIQYCIVFWVFWIASPSVRNDARHCITSLRGRRKLELIYRYLTLKGSKVYRNKMICFIVQPRLTSLRGRRTKQSSKNLSESGFTGLQDFWVFWIASPSARNDAKHCITSLRGRRTKQSSIV